MARLSKSHHFKIFEDTGIPTPPNEENDPFEDDEGEIKRPSLPRTPSKSTQLSTTRNPPSDADDDDDEEEDALPRDSPTSVSTFPESTSQQNDAGYTLPPASPQKFFTPQIIRPSFRRPESVRRMQMSSPRQSLLSHHRFLSSRTPRSDCGRESTRSRRRISYEELTTDDDEGGEEGEDDKARFPLVLLHVTILPVELPWSMESMHEILPVDVSDNLLLLRSKVSDSVSQRGILIPHPREEYEMLEERLLEALELKEERLTKCGHFLGRSSGYSAKDVVESDGDSALGSSSDSEDGEICSTCKHHIRCTAGKKQKWSVRVFAANGMMRAAAWAAAWEGMESVDVEILPWIDEVHWRRLDEKREEEERRMRSQEETANPTRTVEDDLLLLQQGPRATSDSGPGMNDGLITDHAPDATELDRNSVPSQSQQSPYLEDQTNSDLPPIYRASQVPLSVLLRNYAYLLAQDPRNVAIFVAGILAIFLAAQLLLSARNDAAIVSQAYESPDVQLAMIERSVEAPIGEQEDDEVISATVDTPSARARDLEASVPELDLDVGVDATAPKPSDLAGHG